MYVKKENKVSFDINLTLVYMIYNQWAVYWLPSTVSGEQQIAEQHVIKVGVYSSVDRQCQSEQISSHTGET